MASPAWIIAVDTLCVVFALWTLVCNATVLAAGNTYALLASAAAVFALAGAAVVAVVRRRGLTGVWSWFAERPPLAPLGATPVARPGLLWPLLGSACVGLVYDATESLLAGWLTASVYFLAAYVYLQWREAAGWPWELRTSGRSWHTLALLGLGAVCAVVSLVANRPDIDDARYVNMAVGVADLPHQAVLYFDTLHPGKVEFRPPYYRVHSIEALVGLVAWLTGLQGLTIAHLWLPPFASLFLPAAVARLAREVMPARFLWVVLAVVAVYLFDGSNHRGYANFAVVRLFQGKAILISSCAPLIVAYGMRFGRDRSLRSWFFLAASQVAALGLSSTAVWLAPILATLGVGSTLRLRELKVVARAAGLTVLSSLYPLVAGLAIMTQLRPRASADASPQVYSLLESNLQLLEKTLVQTLGDHYSGPVMIAAWLLAWPLATTPSGRRMFALSGVVVTAIAANPYLAHWMGTVTGKSAYWRVMWVAPLPLAFGVLVASLLRPGLRARSWLQNAMVGAGLVAVLVVTPANLVLSRANKVRILRPTTKVPRRIKRTIGVLRRELRPRSLVVAPREVSVWLPTYRDAPLPILTREAYFAGAKRQLELSRYLVHRVNSRAWTRFAQRFFVALDGLGVRGVLMRRAAVSDVRSRQLECSGFEKRAEVDVFELWVATAPLYLGCADVSAPLAPKKEYDDYNAQVDPMADLEGNEEAEEP